MASRNSSTRLSSRLLSTGLWRHTTLAAAVLMVGRCSRSAINEHGVGVLCQQEGGEECDCSRQGQALGAGAYH